MERGSAFMMLCFLLPLLLSCVSAQSSADVNSLWLEQYGEAKDFSLEREPHVLVANGGMVQLYRFGELSKSYDATPPLEYTLTKTICHSSLATFGVCFSGVKLTNNGTAGCGSYSFNNSLFSPVSFLKNLENLANVTVEADLKAAVTDESVYLALREASYDLINFFNDTMTKLISTDCSVEGFAQCIDTMQASLPLMQPLMKAAADSQAKQYGQVISDIRAELGEEAWAEIVVITQTVSAARTMNFETGLWAREIGLQHSGTRLFTVETFDSSETLSNLKGKLSDKHLSQAIFGTPVTMSRDLFANSTYEHVDKYFMSGYPSQYDTFFQRVYYNDSAYGIVDSLDQASSDSTSRAIICTSHTRCLFAGNVCLSAASSIAALYLWGW